MPKDDEELEEIADAMAKKAGGKQLIPIAQTRKTSALFPEGICVGITAEWLTQNLRHRAHEFRDLVNQDFDVFTSTMMSLENARKKQAEALALKKAIQALEESLLSRFHKAEIAAKERALAKIGDPETLRQEWINKLTWRHPDTASRGRYHELRTASSVFPMKGYYYVGMQPHSGTGHAIGLHVTARRARLMDPNTSEYEFPTHSDLLTFLPKYLDALYSACGFTTYQYYFFNDTVTQSAELADDGLASVLPKRVRDLVIDYIY